MTERQFQTELIRGLRSHLFHVVPIPDSGGGARFGTLRVYDLGIAADGVFYGVELKRGSTSIRFDSLQPHQRAGLRECNAAGHIALVVGFFEHTRSLTREKVRRSRKNLEVWAVGFVDFVSAEQEAEAKSAPLSWWRETGIELLPVRVDCDTKKGWEWGWDFRAVHEVMRLRRAA